MKFNKEINTLQASIVDAQLKLDELKAKALEPEPEPKKERVFGFLPEAGSGEIYFGIERGTEITAGYGLFDAEECEAINSIQENYKGLFWKTEKEANAFVEAMNTFLELRAQPEVAHSGFNKSQFYLGFGKKCRVSVYDTLVTSHALSPMFATNQDAQTVLDRFGSERLEQMFRVLGGFRN